VAEEIAKLVEEGQADPRLKWLSDNRVRILTPKTIPNYYESYKQTRENRRRRFYEELDKLLSPSGWKRKRNVYERMGASDDVQRKR
jgi:hypothetical protein